VRRIGEGLRAGIGAYRPKRTAKGGMIGQTMAIRPRLPVGRKRHLELRFDGGS
jgi:hypothetical protein